MRSPRLPSRFYLALVVTLLLAVLVGVELAVRKMPHAYCKAAVDNIWGCSSYKSLKRYLADENSRFFLGDSHVEFMVDFNGFRDYSMPAMLPSEMHPILEYLVRTREVEHVLIGLSAHHLQDKRKTRSFDILSDGTLMRQVLPFPVYALEPALTVGIKNFIWDSLFGRPLPRINGQQMYTDEELQAQMEERWKKQSEAARAVPDSEKLWWQKEALVLDATHWQKKTPKQRNDWALRRFRQHYPHASYKDIDEHKSLVALLDLIEKHELDVCFVRFPHADEWEALAELKQFSRYKKVKAYVREMVEQRNIRYLDTESLDLQLTTEHFRDSDHLLVPVIEALTPTITNACFPALAPVE